MSIIKIDKISKIGIFDDFSWQNAPNFVKYNILFGFNGSGKSTLSNLFNLISSKNIYSQENKDKLFEDIKNDENSKVVFSGTDSQTLSFPATDNNTNYKKIFVFNSNFIADHVYDGSKSNLKKFDISNTQFDNPEIKLLTEQIELKENEIKSFTKIRESTEKKFEELKKEYNQKFRQDFANKNLSIGTQIPLTTQIPNENIQNIQNKIDTKIKEFKLAKNSEKIDNDIEFLQKSKFSKIKVDVQKLNDLLLKNPQNIATDTLTEKFEYFQEHVEEEDIEKVEPWYKLGYQLLSINQTKSVCPLCNSDIKANIKELISLYSSYFDKEYDILISDLSSYKDHVNKVIEILNIAKKKFDKLHEYYIIYNDYCNYSPTEFEINSIIDEFNSIIILIDNKLGNIKKNDKYEPSQLNEILEQHNSVMDELNTYIENLIGTLHSKKVNPSTIENEIRELYKKITIKSLDSFSNNYIANFHTIIANIETNKVEINTLIERKVNLLKELKIEAKKVAEFLTKLGIEHFTIDLNEDNTNENILIKYKSNLKVKSKLRNTLSEGEKTALAFAYFLSKVVIEVKSEHLSKTIIVIDDPISSLDDNRIYNTAFLIFDTFKNFNQLFVLSHNFLFLKYLNPFFEKDKQAYLINNTQISKLPNSISNFQTPYFYMLENIIQFKNNSNPDFEEVRKYLPNYIRRVLETFFSFKYAKLIGNKIKSQSPGLEEFIKDEIIDFSNLPEKTVGNITKTNLKDKLFQINKICDNFSHGNIQQLDNCNFTSQETLFNLASDTLDILDYFDNFQLQNAIEMINN